MMYHILFTILTLPHLLRAELSDTDLNEISEQQHAVKINKCCELNQLEVNTKCRLAELYEQSKCNFLVVFHYYKLMSSLLFLFQLYLQII